MDETDGQKLALASVVGTLSLMLRKAGEVAEDKTRRVTATDLGHEIGPSGDSRYVTIVVTRPIQERDVAE